MYNQLVMSFFYEIELREMTKNAVRNRGQKKRQKVNRNSVVRYIEMEFSDKTDSYCNDTRTHQKH